MFRRLAISVAVTAFGALVPQMASADRVCRQECAGPVVKNDASKPTGVQAVKNAKDLKNGGGRDAKNVLKIGETEALELS